MKPATLATSVTLLAALGCSDATAPSTLAVNAPAASLASGVMTVLDGQLRTAMGTTTSWGHFKFVLHPPNPCLPGNVCYAPSSCSIPDVTAPEGYDVMTVCARIFNPGGETFTAGIIRPLWPIWPDYDVDLAPIASLGSPLAYPPDPVYPADPIYPPDPMRSYTIQGAVFLTADEAAQVAANPGAFQAVFTSAAKPAGALAGALDGSTTGAVGPIAETDVYFAAKQYTVNVTP